MPSATDDITLEDPPNEINPYEVLGLERSATQDQVKTAYRKAALKWHPDKVSTDKKEEAHSHFQSIAFAYAILSDSHRRARYDTTGRTEESLDTDDGTFDWTSFYREQYADIVNAANISALAEKYKGSDEEKEDVLEAYTKGKGNMDVVYEEVMLSNVEVDDDRFRSLIDAAISSGEVESYKKYTHETKASRKTRLNGGGKEAEEAMQHAKDIGIYDKVFGAESAANEEDGDVAANSKGKGKRRTKLDSENALAALIQRRQKNRGEDFLANLEAKYAPNSKRAKGKKRARDVEDKDEERDMGEPPEEAFAATEARRSAAKGSARTKDKKSKSAKT
ncbi:hypothetical protein B0A49_03627 [Cryomyces minteri]|uniref:J domain-containing protein n=1 Tax=Cryomyces minteri TaxID=331657 RepID=A0A4U0XQR1_9PEZI|nr:hypothetical protein B0A49_03627 [Cryomyces minteri]